jgi:hypothetical protein
MKRDDLQRVRPWSAVSDVTVWLRLAQRLTRGRLRRVDVEDVGSGDGRDENHPLGQRSDVRNIRRSEQGAVSLAERERHQNLILGRTELEEISRRQHGLVAMGVTNGRRLLERCTVGENGRRRSSGLRLR